MATFVINVVRRGTPEVTRRIHRPDCRWAGRVRDGFTRMIGLAEAGRLLDRAAAGNDDGRTKGCGLCRPDILVGLVADAT
jgi:hypothetical protein